MLLRFLSEHVSLTLLKDHEYRTTRPVHRELEPHNKYLIVFVASSRKYAERASLGGEFEARDTAGPSIAQVPIRISTAVCGDKIATEAANKPHQDRDIHARTHKCFKMPL